MQRRSRIRFMAIACIFLLLINTALPAVAALHPLSVLAHDRASGISDIDLTISLDWDPAKVDLNVTPRGMSVAETEAVVKSYAASLYAMTNGLHRLRNVYIHKNSKSWANADIRYVGTTAGRSNANVACWQESSGVITMYVYETDTKPDSSPGPVLAHESGHYIYGLLDEYVELAEYGGKTVQQLIGENMRHFPSSEDDGTQPSIMNQHHTYPNWLSTAGSYAGDTKKLKTAHYRNYGKSIWDTLTSDPKTDPDFVRTTFGRVGFEAFSGKQVKGDKELKAAQTGELNGFDGALKIIWVDAPVLNLVLLDANFPTRGWSAAQEGAGAVAKAIPADNMLQILSGSTLGMQRTLISESNRNTLASQAQKVPQASPVSLAAALTAAIAEAKNYQSTLKNAQTSIIHLITTSNDALPASLAREMRQNNVMLKVILYAEEKSAAKSSSTIPRSAPRVFKASDTTIPGDEMIYLSQISQVTGGSFVTVRSTAQLENEASLAATESGGMDFSVLATASETSLKAGEKLALRFKVGPLDQLPVIMMAADDTDFSKLVPSLTSPAGTTITAGNLPSGITLEKDEENSVWSFTIDPGIYSGASGTWTAAMTATTDVASDTAIQVVTPSTLLMQLDVTQRPLLGSLLEVSLKLDRPVLRAKVWADIYDGAGKQVRSGVNLADKGENGDRLPDDGVYTISLNDLPAGEYSFQVYADDNNGTAIASDRGTFFSARKSAMPDEATGPFQRTDAGTFVVAAQASPPSGGGGCAVGSGSSRDLLLLLALVFPLLYLLAPQRRQRQKL